MGSETDELLQTGTDGHQRMWQNVEDNSNSRRRQSPSQGGKTLEDRRTKEKHHEKGVPETCEQV